MIYNTLSIIFTDDKVTEAPRTKLLKNFIDGIEGILSWSYYTDKPSKSRTKSYFANN